MVNIVLPTKLVSLSGIMDVGTGAHGRIPVTEDVLSEAARRGVEVAAMPTEEACRLLSESSLESTNAILHRTC